MGGYIGATAVGLTTTAADVQGDITSTDTTPELILKNTSEEDTEGGREGKITFKGEQSGGEETTLAQIESAHDGTSDDEKGDLIFKTNDGSDGASPTERMRIDSSGQVGIGESDADAKLHVKSNGATQVKITNTNDSATTPARLTLHKSGGSPADDDSIGQIDFNADDSAGNEVVFARIRGISEDVTDGTEDGSLSFWTRNNDTIEQHAVITETGNVGINETAPTAQLHITNSSTDNLTQFLMESTESGTASGPDLALYRNSATPADNDNLGAVWFYGNNDADQLTPYAGIIGQAENVSDGSEDSRIQFFGQNGGSTETFAYISRLGISPSGETASANFLGDVEEGTWTPTASTIYAGPANSSSFTSSGTYKKIDNRVLLEYEIDFNLSGSSVASGDRFIITGLPFGFSGSFVGGGQGFQYGTIGTGNNAIWHNYFHSTSPDYIGFYCHYEDGSVAYNKIIKGNAWYLTS